MSDAPTIEAVKDGRVWLFHVHLPDGNTKTFRGRASKSKKLAAFATSLSVSPDDLLAAVQRDRDEFPPVVKEVLCRRVAGYCSNPQCGNPTSGPHTDSDKSVNVGVAAHITAAAEGGPRYDKALSSAERASAENGTWLCQKCAKLIDSDEKRFTVPVIREWRYLAETAARRDLETSGSVAAPPVPWLADNQEIGRALLKAVFKLRNAIRRVRNPFMSGSEAVPELRRQGLSEQEIRKRLKDGSYVADGYRERWTFISEAFGELKEMELEAEVVWGSSMVTALIPLYDCLRDLRIAVNRHMDGRSWSAELDDTLYEISDDPSKDPFTASVLSAVNGIRDCIEKHLSRHPQSRDTVSDDALQVLHRAAYPTGDGGMKGIIIVARSEVGPTYIVGGETIRFSDPEHDERMEDALDSLSAAGYSREVGGKRGRWNMRKAGYERARTLNYHDDRRWWHELD